MPETRIGTLLKITPVGSYEIKPPTRGEAPPAVPLDAPADAIIKLEYESGLCEWLRVDQFRDELGETREPGPVRVPVELDRGGGTTRGVTGWVLKGLHVFGISPADALANETAEAVINHFDGRLKTGLYPLKPDGSFDTEITETLTDNSRPYLVFIHGTASSTQGSFRGLWQDEVTKAPTPEWIDIVGKYEDHILALEHKTFSVSPAQNALDLVGLLPKNATLHVITHSRGGLVGELLGLGQLSPADLRAFEGHPDEQHLQELSKALDDKRPQVARFVRTACPAAGTILASNRLDLYLNVILNVIGLIPGLNENPGYEVFKATALELIKLRADPEKIPGIEAQMPESPLIHLLNTRGRYSDSDLGVIAGDFEGSGVWGTLKYYALRAYYWEDNDFVVNTKSMSGGMDRKKGVQRFLDRGPNVNHFSYFKNQPTRAHLLSWLVAAPGAEVPDFTRVRGITELQQRSATRGGEDLRVAFLLPDVFGTNLRENGSDRDIWLNYDALAVGRFKDLGANPNLAAGTVHEFYQALFKRLASSHDAVAFPYDWRQPIEESARKLADAVEKKLAERKSNSPELSVRFIAHGMGGLVVREYARQNPERWKELTAEDGGFLMLGTPNRGSWGVARLLTGRSRLVRMLALLGRHSDEEVVAILRSCRGLIDMLPLEMYDPDQWHPGGPDPAVLSASKAWREQLEKAGTPSGRLWYVAGTAASTPAGIDGYTVDGDGQVTWSLGILPNAETWYNAHAGHGDLVSHPDALIEILSTGKTGALDREPHPAASSPDSHSLFERKETVFFPAEADIVRTALGARDKAPIPADNILRVRIAHGNLREARYPLAVGHYAGDSLVSGEAELDRQLDGKLSTRFQMGLYPGRAATADVILARGAHPPGALIVGLGDVGKITPEKVRAGVLEACLRYALMLVETTAEPAAGGTDLPRSAAFSSLLIGVAGGRAISVADSITSTVRAALAANRMLKDRNLAHQVRIDEIQFVELFEDAAIEATHAAARLPEFLKNDLAPGERVEFDKRLRSLPGGLFRRRLDDYTAGWWRRIEITADRCGPEHSAAGASSTGLVFVSLTDRARAEETLAATQTELVDALLKEATRQPVYDEDSAVALFELLLPNALKDRAPSDADLVLVLDKAAAAYPWEFLARRAGEEVIPLSIRSGLIRQLRVEASELRPRTTRKQNALIIGDTLSDLSELPGAQEEASEVFKLLSKNGYSGQPLIRQSPVEIVRQLFAHEYRIIHLAGHGIYDEKHPARSGMVLGRNMYLTSLELSQLRTLPELVFINCCYLGKMEKVVHVDSPHRMAASVAQELIGKGVKAVVAAGWAVNDAAAVVFARTFYELMLGGRKFGEATREARIEARRSGSRSNTWSAYQCYGNPDFMLTEPGGRGTGVASEFYSRQEWLDELKDVTASAGGRRGDGLQELADRIQRAKEIPRVWRDGEVLVALAEAQKAVEDFAGATETYETALRLEKASAPVQAIEQRANLKDRQAVKLFEGDSASANRMWDEAEHELLALNDLLGVSSERLSLLGGLWKRRGGADPDIDKRTQAFKKAVQYYKGAYVHARSARGEIDPYPGLNLIALAYLNGETQSIPRECLEEARRSSDDPNFWQRIYRADAILLEHLLADDVKANAQEVIDAYRQTLRLAPPNQRHSVLDQLQFIAKIRKDDQELQRVVKEASL